ncbi:glycoside hydrolase family 125 protein [Durotheca rogersii]|uniref:glycoside hydrolase family 125 protein n=1 Tax=Durotheca rogersii TaxID=419775 RepID=UPI00221E7AFE|nr:glycoside hydrolase family 125 protein [Durotheca rogersii]KAI5863840.1 glycoside hydrolase family 125 protein [Durotheca rogersii]
MRSRDVTLLLTLVARAVADQSCPGYSSHSQRRNPPLSTGAYKLAYQRPSPECRTFKSSPVEDAITRVKETISDPDLSRLFENTFPNTLDTAIKWRGVSENDPEEELAFVITGDINAMWIRDSSNQIAPYKTVLKDKADDIASVFRGVINLQARYLIISPYCNAFHPPPESGMKPDINGALYDVTPPYDRNLVFTCNFELDDFGGFLQLSHDYYNATGDLDFFGKFQWIAAVQSILSASEAMRKPTYDADGKWLRPAYTFQSQTMSASGTLGNNGMGSPVNDTGMVRSPFRPSDDSALFDFQIPANMMLSRYLESTSGIMERLPNAPKGLSRRMKRMAAEIREAISQWGIVKAPNGQQIFAYEVDGFGGQNLMDDANVPSLLSAPFLGYLDKDDPIYQNTRAFVLSRSNPWWCSGPVINAVGSPHIRPGAAWPMAAIIRAMTSDDDAEITTAVKEVLSSTDGFGLIHESVDSFDASRWTRQWFTWANGLFGQLIMDLADRKPHLLKENYQPPARRDQADVFD